jgi:hypothetical protein
MKLMKKPEYHLAKNVDLEIRLLDEEEAPATPGLFVILVFSFLTVHRLMMYKLFLENNA